MNSSPLPVADTAHVRSFAYVPAPMMEVSPASYQDEREEGGKGGREEKLKTIVR
jgi:hypothetical protein